MTAHSHQVEFASDDLSEMFAVRSRHRQVNQFSVNLIGVVATPRKIDKLVGNNERARLYLFSETADHARADNVPYAERLQRREIGLVWNFMWRDCMLPAVSWQKSDTSTAQFAHDDRRRRLSVRSFRLDGIGDREPRQFTET